MKKPEGRLKRGCTVAIFIDHSTMIRTATKTLNNGSNIIATAIESYLKAFGFDTRKINEEEMKSNLRYCNHLAFSEGVKAYNSSSDDVAIRLFQLVADGSAQLGITDSLANYNLALTYERIGAIDQALKQYDKCLEIGYSKEAIYSSKVFLLTRKGDLEGAARANRKGLEEFPNNINLISSYINYLLATGNNGEALKYLTKALELEPQNHIFLYARGTIHENLKAYDLARADFTKAVQIAPNYFDARYNLGAHFFNQGADLTGQANGAEVKDEYDRLIQQAQEYFSKALVHLEKAHELDSTNMTVLESLKELYARNNDTENYQRMSDLIKEMRGG